MVFDAADGWGSGAGDGWFVAIGADGADVFFGDAGFVLVVAQAVLGDAGAAGDGRYGCTF